jgi:DNA-binding CsgD family transcriptional regulator
VCATPNAWLRGAVAVWLRRLASPRSLEGEVAEPYRLQLDGDPRGAARAWTRLGSPYEAAMALADAPEEEALREALSIVIGLDAQSAAQIIRQRLRVLGARSIPAGPRAATRERPFGLTRREYEVLDLICAEHTNAEIAAKLFLSVKTVDHHVSAVLGKLGVPTRGAARRVVRSA